MGRSKLNRLKYENELVPVIHGDNSKWLYSYKEVMKFIDKLKTSRIKSIHSKSNRIYSEEDIISLRELGVNV